MYVGFFDNKTFISKLNNNWKHSQLFLVCFVSKLDFYK